ncbi:tetratricopeptide repeat protein [Agaribacterium haliotis]|uniref:tetratricopeptide repeat protein n=1 Tax=Agaribacterium haliotis TaxID=2013869 RepID=UPI0011785CF0|nr:PAS sensor protein [Agaribacterium haliotis]
MKSLTMTAKSLASATALAAALFAGPTLLDNLARQSGGELGLASAEAQATQQKRRALPGISEKVFKGLGKASEYANPDQEKNPGKKPDFPRALKELKKLEKACEECNRYEKSQIYNMNAYVAYSMEKYNDAVEAYKKVVAQSPEIPIAVELQSMMYIAQLSFQLEKFQQSIDYLDRWMKLANETGTEVGAEIWQLKSVICYQNNQQKCALDSINKAVSMVEAKGKIAEESWYNLQRAMYLDKEDFKTATKILEKLIRNYPKKSYWAQLGSMYGMIGREKDQLNSMEVTYLMGGYTKERDLVTLSKIYLAEDVPYNTAKILEKGMKEKKIERNEKNLELLALALQRAKESKRAIPVLQEVGKMSKSGNFYGQLTGVYLDLNNPAEAIKAGKRALNKGNFTRDMDGEVHINMGIAYFDLHQFGNAISSFEKAAKIKKHRQFANGWLRYARNEKKRYDVLKNSLADDGLDIEEVIR